MKKLSFLLLFLSFQAMATEVVVECMQPQDDSRRYLILQSKQDTYHFVIQDLDQGRIIHREKVERLDYQGVDVFQGTRSTINLEDTLNTSYTFVDRSSNGRFINRHLTLVCEYGRSL